MKKSNTKAKKGLTSLPIIDLGETNSLQPWKARSYKICAVCGKKAIHYTKTAQAGTVCQACCTAAIENELINSKADTWPGERIKDALSSSATIVERLAVLTHIHPIQLRVDIRDLLIENMGFVSENPLSHHVRQKAFDACASYHNPRQMFDKLLKTHTFLNWQQKSNITKVCYHISPNHPATIVRFEITAKDPSPSARIHIASTINLINTSWAKELWQDLCRDPNPLVREGCVRIAAEQNQPMKGQAPLARLPKVKTTETGSATASPINTKIKYTLLEQNVKNCINFRISPYQKINSQYLNEMRDFIDPNTYGRKKYDDLKENTPLTCIRLIAATLSNKYMFKKLLPTLPAEVGILIYLCTWENYFFFSKDDLKRLSRLRKNGKDKQGKFPELPASLLPLLGKAFPSKTQWDVEVIQNPAFFLFIIERTWNSSSSTAGYKFNIHKDFIPHLKKILPLPALYDVVPVSDDYIDPQAYAVYEEKRFFEQLPTILAFITQDNLEFTKNGDRVKVASLKKMSTLCGLNEFYGEDHPPFKYLKASCLADFFMSGAQWKDEALDNLPLFLKNRIKQYLDFTDYKTLRCRELLNYVKSQKPQYESGKAEKEIRQSFKTLLTLLPKGKWVAVENVVQAICYRGLETSPFSNPVEIDHVRLDLSPGTMERLSLQPEYDGHGCSIGVSKTNTVHTIILPLMNALLFFFGSLNMVSLAYSEPRNDRYKLRNKPYLSIYDGLTYVRLTDFGAFVLDKEKSFSADIEKKTAEIVLDETRTLLSLCGEDPVKRLALESVGKRITTSSYLVDYQSFLKDCSNLNEVQNRIDYFRTHISKNPPEIWETFFQSVLARMDPLKIVKDMYILKVNPDKELIALLTTDPVLKKHVIKAENYHLIVEKKHYPTVKKRLTQFGFF
jgi:hypothetical protein